MIRLFFPLTLLASIAAPLTSSIAVALETAGQAVGYYDHGYQIRSTSLPGQGEGFIQLFERQDRHYGSDGLVQIVIEAAAQMSRLHPEGERLQIGDIAAKNGGPMSGHDSHQNGLDVDLVFFRLNHAEQDPKDSESNFIEKFVRNGQMTSNFDLARNWEMVKFLVQTGRVNRIFVHQAIKNGLCRFARSLGEVQTQAEALRRLRPQVFHIDHMHVRLTCPLESPQCVKQDEVAPGSGCPNP